MSYHLITIDKSSINSPFKILEEATEFIDAMAQGNKIMSAVELSDLYGAMKIQAKSLGISMSDLEIMSNTTERVFRSNKRTQYSLYEYLVSNSSQIHEFGLGFVQVKVGTTNYNFYTDRVSKFFDCEKPHSHKTDFISEILHGTLFETRYSITSGNMSAFCGCGDSSVRLTNIGYVLDKQLSYNKGCLYVVLKEDYHTVSASEGTITKVVKFGEQINAFVFGEKTDYASNKSVDELWDIVKEISYDANL